MSDLTVSYHDSGNAKGDALKFARAAEGDRPAGVLQIANKAEHIERFEFADEMALSGIVIHSDGSTELVGTAAADTINGTADEDILNGAGGSDILTGGPETDTFVFTSAGAATDTVTDFETSGASADALQFESSVFADFNAVLAAAQDDGTDTTITLDADSQVVLKNVLVSNLQSDDFVFV